MDLSTESTKQYWDCLSATMEVLTSDKSATKKVAELSTLFSRLLLEFVKK